MERDLKDVRDLMDKLLQHLDERAARASDQAGARAAMSLRELSDAASQEQPAEAPWSSAGIAERHAGVFPALRSSMYPLAS